VEQSFHNVQSPGFISVGLGLGYNEILIACEALQAEKTPTKILSYEKQQFLMTGFQDWLKGNETALTPTYNKILELFAKHYHLEASLVKSELLKFYELSILEFPGPLDANSSLSEQNGILFDAFSRKTSESLWDEVFLFYFFNAASAKTCTVATYACTGALKRVLKNLNYVLDIRKGYGKKRQSLFAHRKL
jgi:tRNA U34 5-methylaminomethyl-2-thiouridine-forming methyltransferase MnmC